MKRYAVETDGRTFLVYAKDVPGAVRTVVGYCKANGLPVNRNPTCTYAGTWDYHLNQAVGDPTEKPYKVEGKHA